MLIWRLKLTTALLISGCCLFFDRLFKNSALIGLFSPPLNLVKDFFRLNLAENYYLAFSLPFFSAVIPWLITAILAGLIFYLVYALKKNNYAAAGWLLLIISGAASNLWDRFRFGYVIDYFDLKYFTVFNLADVMIVAGVAGFILLTISVNKKTA